MNESQSGNSGSTEAAPVNSCPRCGRLFTCGMAAGEDVCWCVAHPPIFAVPGADAACYCPDCLAELVAQRRNAIKA